MKTARSLACVGFPWPSERPPAVTTGPNLSTRRATHKQAMQPNWARIQQDRIHEPDGSTGPALLAPRPQRTHTSVHRSIRERRASPATTRALLAQTAATFDRFDGLTLPGAASCRTMLVRPTFSTSHTGLRDPHPAIQSARAVHQLRSFV